MKYQPKGGMCASCKDRLSLSCKTLPFKNMPVISSDGETTVVRCTSFKRGLANEKGE